MSTILFDNTASSVNATLFPSSVNATLFPSSVNATLFPSSVNSTNSTLFEGSDNQNVTQASDLLDGERGIRIGILHVSPQELQRAKSTRDWIELLNGNQREKVTELVNHEVERASQSCEERIRKILNKKKRVKGELDSQAKQWGWERICGVGAGSLFTISFVVNIVMGAVLWKRGRVEKTVSKTRDVEMDLLGKH